MPLLSNAHLANKVVCGECVLVHHPEVDPSRGDVAVNLEDQKLDVQRAWWSHMSEYDVNDNLYVFHVFRPTSQHQDTRRSFEAGKREDNSSYVVRCDNNNDGDGG